MAVIKPLDHENIPANVGEARFCLFFLLEGSHLKAEQVSVFILCKQNVFFFDVVVLFDLEGRNTLRSYSRLAFRILGQILAKQMSDVTLIL